jgi:hypothetical protein
MYKKKKKLEEEGQVFKSFPSDGSFPELTSKATIKKSKKNKKKRDVQLDLTNTQMDMIQ